MSKNMFSSAEEKIREWWYSALKDEMAKAGAEERRIAIEKGIFHQGVPAITVICDGGWSKRIHKHTYNAYGGVGVIFGAETNKLLYIGVRNKYCQICHRAKNLGTETKEHNCYQNWKLSSQTMEADNILSGFLEAESTHGVRYLKNHCRWGQFCLCYITARSACLGKGHIQTCVCQAYLQMCKGWFGTVSWRKTSV